MTSPEGMFFAGAGLLVISICGKSATRFIKSVNSGKAFNQGEAILG